MEYTINQWYGRLGNNIQQISNAIHYCQQNKAKFSCKSHHLINEIKINFGPKEVSSGRYFYYSGKNKDFECDVIELNKKRRQICQEFIYPNLKIPHQQISERTLVIHIRDGDAFTLSPHSSYLQNPLSYYNHIIENFEEVLIVTEKSKKNPVIQELIKNKKVSTQTQSLEKDFATLLFCHNLATSGVGTFSISAALCSNHLKNLYCTDIFMTEHLNPTMLQDCEGVSVYMTKIQNYISIGEWRNTAEQRRKMLEHKI